MSIGWITIDTFNFISYFSMPELTLYNATKFCVQLFIENISDFDQTVVKTESRQEIVINEIARQLDDWTLTLQKCYLVTQSMHHDQGDNIKKVKNMNEIPAKVNLFVTNSTVDLMSYFDKLEDKAMIICRHEKSMKSFQFSETTFQENVNLVSQVNLIDEIWSVYLKISKVECNNHSLKLDNIFEIPSTTLDFDWIKELQINIQNIKLIHGRSKKNKFLGIESFF